MRALLAFLVAILLIACAPARDSRIRVVYIPKMIDEGNSFWTTVKEGALSAADDQDVVVSVRGTSEETQVDEQIQIVEAAIREHPAAIV